MDQRIPDRTDVAIVGAGIIGLSLAYELLRRGRRVVVLERERPGAGASSVAPGMLAPTSEAYLEEPVLITLALDSLGRYPRFVAELEAGTGLGCALRTDGTLWVALNRDDDEELAYLERAQREKGLVSRRLTAREVLDREPHLAGRLIGGLLVETDHQVDPRCTLRALEAAIAALGGLVLCPFDVREVRAKGNRVAALAGVDGAGAPFEIACEVAVIAAGSWSSSGIALPGPPLGVRPVRGQSLRLRGPELLRHVVRHPDVYLVPRAGGELLVGATVEEQGFEPVATAGGVLDLLRFAWQVLPGIYDLELHELAIGLRPAVRDHLPVIGAGALDGLFLATGHYRSGILLAPATAQHLAEMIVSGRPQPALAPFAPERLAARAAP
ncbi:MAG: glycine oxidase ThiO [Acidobacteria bacterium]|nr:glycine oxidase ThiO [Acidobacteriota bacterium]